MCRFRTISACFLCLLFALQWLVGVSYVQVRYAHEIRHRMDASEAEIAAQLARDHGVTGNVSIADSVEVERLFSRGYGTPAVFHRSDELGRGAFFTIVGEYLEHVQVVDLLSPDQDDASKSMPFKKLGRIFPDLFLSEQPFTLYGVPALLTEDGFGLPGCATTAHPSLFYPPPRIS